LREREARRVTRQTKREGERLNDVSHGASPF
jgi:hypothetical protein